MSRLVSILPAVLALAACDPAPVDVRPIEPVPSPSTYPGVQPPQVSGPLGFVDGAGAERLQLDCRADGRLHITVPGFEPIGSEDRLTLGAGDEAFTHVADLEAPGPGVTGSGPFDGDLLDRLARGEPVGAVYGTQSVGPLHAARPEALVPFTKRCRGLPKR